MADHPPWHVLQRQLAALRAKHLAWLAAEDPSLDRLAAALAEERHITQLDPRGLLAFVQDLAARYDRHRKDAR